MNINQMKIENPAKLSELKLLFMKKRWRISIQQFYEFS